MFGLKEELINKLLEIKEKYNIEMCVFGSRARGDYKNNSDIDIAILNEIEKNIKFQIMNDFDKIDTIYKIDLVFIQDIQKEEFLNSIKMEGIKI